MNLSNEFVRYSYLLGLFRAAYMVRAQVSVAQAEPVKQPITQEQVKESAQVNSEQIREEVQRALAQVAVHSVVHQAMEWVRESLEQAS